ncbi:ATP-dependent zinc metalloprotease FtsH 4 [Anatilimnocola aggregata]|uniref:ATP-dependent zinc metalloprotease FtsH n=1 Tax=Anatilimnocola aggregata TaxID=2528021 RepID=A0A517YEF6_9BACT|nr:ATP-dependent zinc metalloprotease FtsH [Anatilimnocola aggregata]QDU28606.1 ATP-dependent zinc metalloprotease FtsH 4 [Anatilimnocola aggregata]
MSNENGPGRSGMDKGGMSGMNLFAIVILVLLAGLLTVVVSSRFFHQTMRDSDLIRLIQASKEPHGHIDIRDEQSGTIYRYSNLRSLVIHDQYATAVVERAPLVPTKIGGEMKPDGEKLNKKVRILANLPPGDGKVRSEFEQAVIESKVERSFAGPPNPLEQASPYILSILIGLLVIYIMVRRLAGAGSPMSFGRSRGKLYAQEDLGVTFNDVAGIDEAVEEVREVVDFLRMPEKYQRLGGRIPKGVLLVGPPGTGKTLLAKAIAGEAGVPFFSLSGSDFVEMFVGVGAARVRDMFLQAEAKAPCIIFIDELDALGKSRGNGQMGGHDEREQTLNALLVEMDGFGSNSGVIVMAATNRPETLDPALLRPGRFDRHVLVDRPDIKGREDILKVHVKQVKLDPSVELREIAAITPGFVGADLANLVNEAALLAARKEKNSVGMAEFNDGVERVTAGLEKKQRVMNDEEKLRVAYHESGHALVAYSLPNTDPVHKVSIIPRGLAALGYTMQRPEGDRFLMTQSELESRIQVLFGGTLAEEMIYSDISTGASNDLERASEIARNMVMQYGMSRMGRVCYKSSHRSPFLAAAAGEEYSSNCSETTQREIDQEVRRILDEANERVRHILEVRRSSLEALTRRLIEVESVDADELKRIMNANSPGPLVVPGTTVSPRITSDSQDNLSSGSIQQRG